MSKTLALCGFGLATRNEICVETAAYRADAHSSNGKRVTSYLCSNHVHRAWQLTQLVMDRKFPGENLRVKSIHLHQLRQASKAAEAAS